MAAAATASSFGFWLFANDRCATAPCATVRARCSIVTS
jgi:hypothetical protein